MPLVAAVACPSTPQLLIRPETEDRALVLRVHTAYAQVKRWLTEARPEAICLIAGDRIEGFFLDAVRRKQVLKCNKPERPWRVRKQ